MSVLKNQTQLYQVVSGFQLFSTSNWHYFITHNWQKRTVSLQHSNKAADPKGSTTIYVLRKQFIDNKVRTQQNSAEIFHDIIANSLYSSAIPTKTVAIVNSKIFFNLLFTLPA